MQTEVIEATPVNPITTTDVFVVMYRYGPDYWSACTTWKTVEDAQRSAATSEPVAAWKIVKVSGLPVAVNDGEALMGSNVEVRGAEAGSSPERPSRLPSSAAAGPEKG